MSKVVKGVLGVALTIVGAVTGQVWLVATGLSMVSSAVFSPGGPAQEPRQASETTLQLGEYPRQVLFGKVATAGSLIDAFNYGGEYDTDWEVQLIALADHECEELVGFYVNDEYKSIGGNGPVTGFSGQLEVHFLPGTATQAWPSLVTANGPGWNDPANNCAGMACIAVAYKADDPEAENPVWSGRPRFLWIVKGKKCYNPALDSTVEGGSGSHRYDDPSTWEWTDNANVCRYQFQRGIYALDRIDQPDQLLLGRGLSAVEAPPERSIAHTAVCDETDPDFGGGTQKRYTFNGLIGSDETFLTAEGYFAEAMGGVIRQPEGGIEVEPGQPKAAVVEITDADILNLEQVEVEYFRSEDDREWVNTVIPRYVEPTQKWKMHSAAIRREFDDVVADGGQRTQTLELKHVTVDGQAQRLGEIKRRLGRLLTVASIPLGPRFCELEEGDWIGWTSARHFKGERKVFRIERFNRDGRWHHQFGLREIDASIYGWNDADDLGTTGASATLQPPRSGIAAPGPSIWTAIGTELFGKGRQPALKVTGATENSRAEAVRIEFRKTGETIWEKAGDFPPSMATRTLAGVADETEYEVAISYIIDGTPGARRVLPPVTTGAIGGASGAARIVTQSVAYPMNSDDTSITIVAFDATLNTGEELTLPADTLSGLASGTYFGVFRDRSAGAYIAVQAPATSQHADRDNIFLGWMSTSTGGSYPTQPTPPGGYGGTGGHTELP